MTILNFPTSPSTGTTHLVNSVIYTWNGYAWYKTNNGNQTYTNLTATNSITINGNEVITTATTSTVHFLNTTDSTSTTTGAVVIDGGLGIGGDVWIEGRVNAESVMIADTVFDSTESVNTTTMSTVIDQYPVSQFRSTKYLVQIDDEDNGNFQVTECLMLVVNTGSSYSASSNEYGTVTNNGELGVFQTNIIGGPTPVVQFLFQATTASNKTVKVLRIAMTP